MKINDQILSAFLDHELPEAEMEAVREAIVEDESIAEQLAELASADAAVINTYSKIDQVPLPDSIKNLLETNESLEQNEEKVAANNVIEFPLWKRTLNKVTQVKPLAAAAAIAAVIVGSNMIDPSQPGGLNDGSDFAQLGNILDQQPSGQTVKSDSQEILIRASFASKDGNFCRQFRLAESGTNSDKTTTENIACKKQNSWQLMASSEAKSIDSSQANQYQTATDKKAIDAQIDELIQGGFYSLEQEQQLIETNWKRQSTKEE
jgi:hypothetical protein